MCYAFVALTAGLLVACGGGGGGVSPTPTPTPFVLPVITENGQPVEGIHYVRSDDDSMLESDLTDAEGKVDPRLPDNTESAQIIFAVGPITPTVRNGERIFDFDTENGGFEIGRVSRPTRGWSGIDLFSGGLLECTNCERYLNLLIRTPNGLTVSPPPSPPPPPFVLPAVTENGRPVEGIHYIRSNDDSMLESELTDAEGRINPRWPDNTESAQIIFAVGPITLATVRNGERIFDFDTENGGFEIGRVSRPTRGWSGIDLFSGGLLECTNCERYLNLLIRTPNGLTVSPPPPPPFVLPAVTKNGQPVEGVHYILSDDDSMLESDLTDAEGKVNPRLPDNTESATNHFRRWPNHTDSPQRHTRI